MGVYMERTESVVIRGCRFHNLGAIAISVGRGVQPYKRYVHTGEENIPASRIIGNVSQCIYVNTVFDRLSGHNNGIVDCVIDQVGAGGISMGGGDRIILDRANNYIENCRISRFNRIERSYRPGIQLTGVGTRVSHCEIFDAPSSAITLQGNDHLIEYCEIYNVCNEIDDLGAIYYGRDQSDQGNALMYNYVHDLSDKRRVSAFYHDDGACGMYVYGNILYKAGLQPVLIGGGSDNHYKNNIFIDMPHGLYVDNRLQNWAQSVVEFLEDRLEAVHYDRSPFKDRYPRAAGYVAEGIATPKRNVAECNLFTIFRNCWYVLGSVLMNVPIWRCTTIGLHGAAKDLRSQALLMRSIRTGTCVLMRPFSDIFRASKRFRLIRLVVPCPKTN